MKQIMKNIINWDIIKGYFRIMTDKEDEQKIINSISNDVTFNGATLWVLIFAIFIASLGLNINSTAVIIGAMLISPLMGPITGMGLALGINDFKLLKLSFKNYFLAALISVVTATLYFLISPFNEMQSELLARTSPTLYDVLIAFCGGAAGIVAICTKGKGNVLPGVAIATALMPPLCTAGYGIATGHLFYFLSAFYLFFINTVFICLATYLGVKMLNFKHKKVINVERQKKIRRYTIIIVTLTVIPAGFITFNIIKESIFNSNINRFIKNEFNEKGTQVVAHDVQNDSKTLRIVAVGKLVTDKDISKIKKTMYNYQLGMYSLQVIQGTQSDSLMMVNKYLNKVTNNQANYTQIIEDQSNQIKDLVNNLNSYKKYEKMSETLRPQLKVLFPEINTLALQQAVQTNTDTTATEKYIVAIIGMHNRKGMNKIEMEKFTKWIKTFIPSDSVRIIKTTK
ncbi:MAG: TIGR00341 family protein [Prevotella sp.]|nr:TIGR00341 family protein [Prevotella sp.]